MRHVLYIIRQPHPGDWQGAAVNPPDRGAHNEEMGMNLSPDSQARITQYVREQFGQPSVVLCYIAALSGTSPDGALFGLAEFNRLYKEMAKMNPIRPYTELS